MPWSQRFSPVPGSGRTLRGSPWSRHLQSAPHQAIAPGRRLVTLDETALSRDLINRSGSDFQFALSQSVGDRFVDSRTSVPQEHRKVPMHLHWDGNNNSGPSSPAESSARESSVVSGVTPRGIDSTTNAFAPRTTHPPDWIWTSGSPRGYPYVGTSMETNGLDACRDTARGSRHSTTARSISPIRNDPHHHSSGTYQRHPLHETLAIRPWL